MSDYEDDDSEARHHADMLAFEHEAREALLESAKRPLTPDEISMISWWAKFGIQPQEIRQ